MDRGRPVPYVRDPRSTVGLLRHSNTCLASRRHTSTDLPERKSFVRASKPVAYRVSIACSIETAFDRQPSLVAYSERNRSR